MANHKGFKPCHDKILEISKNVANCLWTKKMRACRFDPSRTFIKGRMTGMNDPNDQTTGIFRIFGQFSMGWGKRSKMNIYIFNFFCDVSRAELHGEFSSENKIEKKKVFLVKTLIFAIDE